MLSIRAGSWRIWPGGSRLSCRRGGHGGRGISIELAAKLGDTVEDIHSPMSGCRAQLKTTYQFLAERPTLNASQVLATTTIKLKLKTLTVDRGRCSSICTGHLMERECSGCKWISGEIDRRNGLINQFQSVGDYQFAQIAQEGIGALVRDWRAHVQRDHGTDAKPILTLSDAVNAPGVSRTRTSLVAFRFNL